MPPNKTTYVLIAEDDADFREGLKLILEGEGLHVRETSGGRTALEEVLMPDVSVAVLDLKLPDLDGWTVAKEVRKTFGPRDKYLVALTGFSGTNERLEAAVAGFDAFFAKPILDTGAFVHLIRNAVAEHTAASAPRA